MTSKHEHIRQLYLEKISGVISSSDEVLLEQMLEEDVECQEVWNALSKEAGLIKAPEILSRIDVESELNILKRHRVSAERRTSWFGWGPIAAAAALLLISFFILTVKQEKRYSANGKSEAKERVRLILGTGQSVDLGSIGKAGTVLVGDVQLKVSKNTLKSVRGGETEVFNTLIVPAAADYAITLSDGTSVRLNSGSRLRFPSEFGSGNREVEVEGEAFFEVAKDTNHPFIVRTGPANIHVLGTSFNLNTYNKGIVKTSLLSGSVLITDGSGHELHLKPGFEAEFSSERGFTERAFDQDDVLSWMKGIYYFHNTPLSELKPVIERWFDIDVVFDQDELTDRRISGLLEKDELNNFLKDLQGTVHINFYQKGNTLHLAR